MAMDRREFLLLCSAALAATAAPGLALASSATVAPRADVLGAPRALFAAPTLLDGLGEGAVRTIGARYRAAVPTEDDAATLRAALVADLTPGADPADGLAARIAADFAEARTVSVDG
jgi:hypothetical protein